MKKRDIRVLLYFSIMFSILSCVAYFYNLLLFNTTPSITSRPVIAPSIILIAIGIVMAAVNGISANMVSEIIREKLEAKTNYSFAIAFSVFFITLVITILLALIVK